MEEKFPESRKVIKIGWVGLGPFSFYGHYIHVINNIFRDYNFLNMRVTHIWADNYRKNFAGSPEYIKKMLDYWENGENCLKEVVKKCSIPNVVNDFHDMADKVDAAMIMDFDRSYELAEPFLKKGLPIFLCSPVAVSVPELQKILDLAKSSGSAVYSGSFTTDMHENQIRYKSIKRASISSADASKRKSSTDYVEVKKDEITTFFASTAHHFFTSYANDGLEPVHRLIGKGARKVSLIGWDGSKGYDPTGIPISRIHLEYEPRGENPPIQGVLTLGGNKNEMEWFKVYYTDHTILEGKTDWSDMELVFRDFLVNLQEVFTTNKSLEYPEDILYTLKVVIAAYKSANEGNRPVSLDEVGDYRLPTVRIEKWNEIPKN